MTKHSVKTDNKLEQQAHRLCGPSTIQGLDNR